MKEAERNFYISVWEILGKPFTEDPLNPSRIEVVYDALENPGLIVSYDVNRRGATLH